MNRRPIVAALWFALLLSASVRAEDAALPRVSTVGTASIYVVPDRVDLQFTITTFDADLQRAKAASDLAATGRLQFFKVQNVGEASIRADFARSEAI